ncbi:hypothetical protein CBER1_04634 [Cercospora berteroae]|uniref:GST N-terminal domain-containing protein n=1 Tax=Cercospora berteroae TaxID=357750 RepID=A0A2S6C2H1_9PEZI|nr:hypothetical protein CBER1_04634 [Cercospora berteroae]
MGSADPEKPLYTLLSATPSPYARKVRISLLEKGIPFELQTEVPWDSDTQTPNYNPLEKLPVLIDNATGKSVYESAFILEWIEVKHKDREPKLIPADDEDRLQVKEIEVVADGICDALVLLIWERNRSKETQSEPWAARQTRKVTGGIKALNNWVTNRSDRSSPYVHGSKLSIADLAICSVLGFMNVRFPDHEWQSQYPELKSYWQEHEKRVSFKATVPVAQTYKDKIV